MVNVLVVGLREVAAGKTTLARALLSYMREQGFDVCGFKPRAGNNSWYDYDVVYEALSQGRLYGKDSKLLREASGTNLPEEVISPVHRLWAEPTHEVEKLFSDLPFFIVDRVTLWGERPRTLSVVNETLPFEHGLEKLLQNLYDKSWRVFHISTLKEFNRVVERYYDRAVELVHREILKRYEFIVYESYQDVAMPWRGIKDLSLVLGIEPRYIFAYEPERFLDVVELSTNIWEEVKMDKIVNMLKPIRSLRIRPCRGVEATQALKEELSSLFKDLNFNRR